MKEAIVEYEEHANYDGSHNVISTKELVRCKDCKWYVNDEFCGIKGVPYHRNPNWFCADGERAE